MDTREHYIPRDNKAVTMCGKLVSKLGQPSYTSPVCQDCIKVLRQECRLQMMFPGAKVTHTAGR